MTRYRLLVLSLVVPALLLGACATTSGKPDGYRLEAKSSGKTMYNLLHGTAEVDELELPPEDGIQEVGMDRLFIVGEATYWAGDTERAFELYGRMLRQEPGHPLNRFAAARLYDLRNSVVDYRARVRQELSEVTYADYGPVARVYLSLIGQTVTYRDWRMSESHEPFYADGIGFATAWMTTPKLSPWGEVDFERSFSVEKQTRIANTYRSPWFAEKRPVNRQPSKPYLSGGLRLSPRFVDRGIYYLETFVTVEPKEGEAAESARDYWVYGNFAAATEVRIGGKQVFEREMDQYGSGKRLRRIGLEPGTHRVLVKLAFQPGYRDWFDLAFIGDRAGPFGGSGMSFSKTPPEGYEANGEGPEFGGEVKKPSQLGVSTVRPERVDEASPSALYLTALAAYYDRQPGRFEPAIEELHERFPDFAAGYGLRAQQVRTLWELPSAKRTARATEYLRKARERNESSLRYVLELAEQLQRRNSDSEEARELLEFARDAAWARESGEGGDRPRQLRNVRPLIEWAGHLSEQGFNEAAEEAWREVLEAEPGNCHAARQLENRYAARRYYPALEEITEEFQSCPRLERNRARVQPDSDQMRLAWHKRQAKRYPYRSSPQIAYADELRAQGKDEQATTVLKRARDRMPWSNSIWNRLAEQALAKEGPDEAIGILQKALEQNGSSRYLLRRISEIENDIPLRELVRDGREAVVDHLEGGSEKAGVEGKKGGDEAYYLIDYAVRDYEPDGASRTLTHTVVRTMTKSAIDRFGETSIPGNAELLVARTINKDGTTAVPQRTSGKSTLSMPELDPGDFVEIAYLQYDSQSRVAKSHVEGLQFFFKMSDISSLHSEYAIVGEGVGGDGFDEASRGEFIRQNDPPEPKTYKKAGYDGVHFLRKDSPRPRMEPNTPGGREYLPWIQYYRNGVEIEPFEIDRRTILDRVRGSLTMSDELRGQVAKWREGVEAGSAAEVRKLFYKVARRITDPDADAFGTSATHTLLSESGSPHLLLHAAYQIAGIDSQLYLVKSKYRQPDEFPVGEFFKYRRPLLRVEMPDRKAVWLSPGHPDAMFNAVGVSMLGQPAVCISCEEPERRTVPTERSRPSHREITLDGELDKKGTLSGKLELTVNGIRATSVRANLRGTPSTTRRRKLMGRVLNSIVEGSTLESFEIEDEQEHDEPLVLEIAFERPNWARKNGSSGLKVERPLFREPIASGYAKLRYRTRPLMIGAQRETDYRLRLDLPEGASAKVGSRSGEWSIDGEWGDFRRNVRVEEGALKVDSSIRLPIQRVSPAQYPTFRKWAVRVERSSRLVVDVGW